MTLQIKVSKGDDMPLRAIINNRVVSVFNYTDQELRNIQGSVQIGKLSVECIECAAALQVRCIDSTNKIAHFFHVAGDKSLCPTGDKDYFTHELFKESLKLYLRESELFNVVNTEEESVEEIRGGNKGTRRIDIKATNWDGSITAHEVQLSHQSVGQLQKRTEDYKSRGYDCIWWLGENFNTAVQDALTKNEIKWGHAIRVDQTSVKFDYVPLGVAMRTHHGGKAKITGYNPATELYQSGSRAWWKLVNGVLVEAK